LTIQILKYSLPEPMNSTLWVEATAPVPAPMPNFALSEHAAQTSPLAVALISAVGYFLKQLLQYDSGCGGTWYSGVSVTYG
jgi:hypothetical protein